MTRPGWGEQRSKTVQWHDPLAAAYTDRVIFLADGRVVEELRHPTSDTVLARMAAIQSEAMSAPPAAPEG